MTTLLEIREYLKGIYSRYAQIITMAARFFIALIAAALIGSHIGYNSTVTGILASLVVALLSTLMPWGAISAVLAAVILLDLWSLSMEVTIVAGILFLLIFLLYYRFSPRDGILLILTPISCVLGIPYVMPLAAGLLFTPASAVSVSFGYVIYYFIKFISDNATSLTGTSGEAALESLTFLGEGVFRNETMIVMIVAGIFSLVVVYFVRRLRAANAWLIASGAGALVELVVLLVGGIRYDIDLSIGFVFLGMVISLLICLVLIFLFFNLDYSRVESLQFEDDDYYYYVKAVPKVSLKTRERTVKRINQARRQMPEDDYSGDDREGMDDGYYRDDGYEENAGSRGSYQDEYRDPYEEEYSGRSAAGSEDSGYADDRGRY